ncbi:hypothetical protein [uncultured Enterococcus sp.]|uniref:hypothetical protein n=1 Tax=uncultured Enterococcus sp. TaxID=167972 RepID=UPI002AA90FEE|nr:hypothetical protein [uncultured Enterococcus sp.]
MVKYVSADSATLIQGLTTNIATAKGMTNKLTSGSQHLIQSVDGKQLSGAAFTAGQGLFKELILPTIERMDSAIDTLKGELGKYQAADGAVNRWAVIDEAIQQALIDSYKSQIAIIDFQIQSSKKLGLVGKLAKSALESIAYNNRRLEQARRDIQEKIREEREKLEALAEFQAGTSGLFQDSLNQLKIGMQGVEILELTTVDPVTGAYSLPRGFDASWFTSAKSVSVTERRKQVALENGMASLGLTEEAQKYYQELMKKLLKDMPVDQWDRLIQELNQIILFDDEGNMLSVEPVNFGAGNGVIVLKNGQHDTELTSQANRELSAQQLEAFKENFPQLALGVMEVLTGLGFLGLDLVGTYFSGGTLAMVGLTQAAAVTGTAITAGGALTLADAISKMGLQSGTASYSFAEGYSQRQSSLHPNGVYKPSPKHNPKGGWGSEMDLDVDEAQKLLDKSLQNGKQKYGIKDGQIYEFQPDNAGTWHGYKIKSTELVSQKGGVNLLKQWLSEGKINLAEYRKLIKGK